MYLYLLQAGRTVADVAVAVAAVVVAAAAVEDAVDAAAVGVEIDCASTGRVDWCSCLTAVVVSVPVLVGVTAVSHYQAAA